MVDLVRQVNPNAPIVITLSPVPLEATFRDISCMTADSVSKSVLRVAIDQVMGEHRPNVCYWPSFEIVRWAGAHVSWPAYGFHDDRSQPRHPLRRRTDHRRVRRGVLRAGRGRTDALAADAAALADVAGRQMEAIGERRRKRAAEAQRNEKRIRRREKREKRAATD